MSILLRLLLLPAVCLASFPSSVVRTDDGPVQGSRDLITGVSSFHGLPFAAPPVDKLRWKLPTRPEPWTKTRRVTTPGASCPQFDFIRGFFFGSEDCMYLSVYVPEECTASAPCPVMQWVYGGAWILGSNREFGLYDASQFARKHGVVVVAANYRLDSFGWLALEELRAESADGSYGNYGLKDQRFALEWTQRNIKQFGGDPNKVTIFGESAGGWSVCQHIVSPGSNHLFSHAIMQSGDCDGPWMIQDGLNAKRFGDAFATAAGCASNSSTRMECLRSLSTSDAMEPYISWLCLGRSNDPFCNKSKTVSDRHAWPNLLYDTPGASGPYWPTPLPPMAPVAAFTAVVDGTEAGLPDVPLRMLEAGLINKSPTGEDISVILGTNHDEFALFLNQMQLTIPSVKLPFRTGDMAHVAQHLVQYHDHWNQTTVEQIVAAYDPAQFKTQSEMIIVAGTDFTFRCGTRSAAGALDRAGIDTYLYVFDFHTIAYRDPASESCHLTKETGCGVPHGAELGFVFGTLPVFTPAALKMTSAIGQYWSNMAKHGTPNGEGGVEVQWPKFNATSDLYLSLAANMAPKTESRQEKEKCDFWDSLPRFGKYPS